MDDLDEAQDDLRGYRSLFHGPAPRVVFAQTSKDEFDALREWIEECQDDGIDVSDICVLARRNDDVKDIGTRLRAAGYDTVVLHGQKTDDRSKSGVRVGTMHRSKGLEFDAVALVMVNDGAVPPKWLVDQAPDPAIRRSIIDAEKSLIHVSATRAKKRLFVGSSGRPSELIAHLENAIPAE